MTASSLSHDPCGFDPAAAGSGSAGTLVRVQPEDSWGCNPSELHWAVSTQVSASPSCAPWLSLSPAFMWHLLLQGLPCGLGVSHTLVTQESHSLRSSRPQEAEEWSCQARRERAILGVIDVMPAASTGQSSRRTPGGRNGLHFLIRECPHLGSACRTKILCIASL